MMVKIWCPFAKYTLMFIIIIIIIIIINKAVKSCTFTNSIFLNSWNPLVHVIDSQKKKKKDNKN